MQQCCIKDKLYYYLIDQPKYMASSELLQTWTGVKSGEINKDFSTADKEQAARSHGSGGKKKGNYCISQSLTSAL